MSRPIFESTNHPLRRNRQRIRKIPLKSTISEGFWSEWRDSNARLPHPKCGALPTGLHPDIQFLSLYHGGEENQRFFCLWSFMWSKPLLCRFRQEEEIPQTQALQGFEAFRLTLSRIQPRHSQTTRATSCATPREHFYYICSRRVRQVLNLGDDKEEAAGAHNMHSCGLNKCKCFLLKQ